MFVVILQRIGIPHIFNYLLSDGQIRTLCGKNLSKNNTDNTIACDNVFTGICNNCATEAEDIYQSDLTTDPRIVRNSWQSQLEYLRSYHYQEFVGPSISADDIISRNWNKFNKIKNIEEKKK